MDLFDNSAYHSQTVNGLVDLSTHALPNHTISDTSLTNSNNPFRQLNDNESSNVYNRSNLSAWDTTQAESPYVLRDGEFSRQDNLQTCAFINSNQEGRSYYNRSGREQLMSHYGIPGGDWTHEDGLTYSQKNHVQPMSH